MDGTLTAPDAGQRYNPRRRRSPRIVAFWITAVCYALLTIGVVFKSALLDMDDWFYHQHLHVDYPQYNRFILDYVMLGQRGPATLVFLPYFFWVAWRTRSSRPLVMLGTALVLLNISVGVMKLLTGRLGPQQTRLAHEFLVGGDIYPSGHVANTVVLYGLIAWITLRYRKLVIAAAVFVIVTVSLGTVYLNTHWFTDVIGGWLAGALVLLALPTVMPTTQRWTDWAVAGVRARLARRRAARQLPAAPQQKPVDAASEASEADIDPGEVDGQSPQPVGKHRVPRAT